MLFRTVHSCGGVVGDAPMNVAITQGLELDCDLNPSNNLEINWAGHHFHMLDFLSAVCLDDPTIHQQPPAAPLNTMIGVGTGRYDGVDGYTVKFTLIDAGEPVSKPNENSPFRRSKIPHP